MAKQEKKAEISMMDGNLTIPGEYVERLIDLLENGLEKGEERKDKELAIKENREIWLNGRKEFIKNECIRIEDRMKKLDVLSSDYSDHLRVYNKLVNIDKSYMWN